MSEETEVHKWERPVSIDESPEDTGIWENILIDWIENDLDLEVPFYGTEAERPDPSTVPGLVVINESNDPPTIERSDGAQYEVIGNTSDADTHVDIEDDGSSVLTDAGILDFGDNLSTVVNGSEVTINAADLDTDTRVNVSDDGSQVVPNVTDINFGSNLSVTDDTDSSVTVDGSGGGGSGTTTTLFMSDYVTPGVCDTEFETAISDASPGDRIVFDHGDYELQTGHSITKSLIIDGTSDSTLICSNTANVDPSIEFTGGGLTGTSTTTSAAVDYGTRSIPVTDSSAFSVGDDILLANDAHSASIDTVIQFAQIKSIPNATTITLFGSTVREFISGANVYQVDLLDAPEIRNLNTTGGGYKHFTFAWCKNPIYRDVSITDYREISLHAIDSWKPRFINVEARNPTSITSGQGEPISPYRCSDVYIESPRVYDCRRGIDMAWGTHSITINDPVIQGFDIAGISIHGGDHCDHLSINGGTISADPNGTVGNGIYTTEFCSASVEGTTIIGRRSCIQSDGPMHVSNCTLRPCSGYADNLIIIKGSDVHYSNCIIDDPNSYTDIPVRIDTESRDVENVTLDLDIHYGDTDAIYMETTNAGDLIDGVTFRGSIRGGSTSQAVWFYSENGTMDNIDFSMDIHDATDQCVRLDAPTGEFGTVRFHDCHMQSAAKAAIYDRNALGANSIIQISNCTFETGATALSFNDQVNKLFVVNNSIVSTGAGTIDQSGATNATVTGNL